MRPVAALAEVGPDLDGDAGRGGGWVGGVVDAQETVEGGDGGLQGAGEWRDDDQVGWVGEADFGGLALAFLGQDGVAAWEA